MVIQFGQRPVDFSLPKVMGILNVTPDSFSDGGQLFRDNKADVDLSLKNAEAMVANGATFIDVGGESTRPGAQAVSLAQEMDRVLPVVEAIAKRVDCIISVDTSSPEVILESGKLGVGLINDVRALTKPGALQAAASVALPVCLMHMRGSPKDMQLSPRYDSVVEEVATFFQNRVRACLGAGILKNAIILDPGIGFGKTDEHNILLLQSLKQFAELDQGHMVLVGVSRKSIIGRLLGREVDERLAGSLAFGYHALLRGANILRVHDVKETADVVRVFSALHEAKSI